MSPQWPGSLFCVLFLLLGTGCGPRAGPTPPSTSHAGRSPAEERFHSRMVARLKQAEERAQREDPYFQRQSLLDTERVLAATDSSTPPQVLAQLYLTRARDLRRFGDDQSALQALAEVRRIEQSAQIQRSEPFLDFEEGLTWLRAAEQENCLHCEDGTSCLLPITSAGIHRKQEYSRQAAICFNRYLEQAPDDLSIAWLLNIASMTAGDFPTTVPPGFRLPEDAFRDSGHDQHFTSISSSVGLAAADCGGGAVAEDFDGDGWIDLMTSSWEPGGQIRLYQNQADGTFKDVTESSGLLGITGGINLIPGDYDNDGKVDVFVARGAWLGENGRIPNSLLHNLGEFQFTDVAMKLGVGVDELPSCTAAWSDIDLDGDLDLFVGNEGPPSRLYLNVGSAGFHEIGASAGVQNGRFTKAASWGDYDNDGLPDLYVSNLNSPNRLYRNNGNLTFSDVAPALGVTEPMAGFPAWFWDVNNDGHLDIFAAAYDVSLTTVAQQYLTGSHDGETARLYLADGNGGFTESAAAWGLTFAEQPMGANFGDINNDGFLDFLLGTGYPEYEALMPNLMYLNERGQGFRNITFSAGLGHLQKGHGVAFADFDNDGDQDIFIEMGGALPGDIFQNLLFENPGTENHWIRLRLQGTDANRNGIGARVRIVTRQHDGTQHTSHVLVSTGGAFGANPAAQHVGLRDASRIEELEIRWPSSETAQLFRELPIDCELTLTEGSVQYSRRSLQSVRFPRH